MSLYDFDTDYIGPKLMPPSLRKVRHTQWIKVLLKPIATLWRYIFKDYADGSNYSLYSSVASYVKGDKIIYPDKKIYQCLQDCTGIDPPNSTYWVLININFMGARERVKYNSQIMLLEYAINKWFFVAAPPYIYISNNATSGRAFLLGETGDTSSSMAQYSQNQNYFLGQTFQLIQYDFTINVPSALFSSLGTTDDNRRRAVRAFADQYVLAGINYNVIPY